MPERLTSVAVTMLLLLLTVALFPIEEIIAEKERLTRYVGGETASLSSVYTKVVILPVENTFNASDTPPGSLFIVNATVLNVTDLQIWQIKLTWDSSLLNFSRVFLPSDHVFSGSGRLMINPPADTGPGYVSWGCTYFNYPYWTFNGTGTLCQIELKILTPPVRPPSAVTCNLTFTDLVFDTYLLDGTGNDIPFSVEDGIFRYNDYLSVSLNPSGIVLVNFGGTVTFTATAVNGSLPYRYQWFFTYPNSTVLEVTEAENQTSWECYQIKETGTHKVTAKVTDNAMVQTEAFTSIRIRSLYVALTPDYPVVDVGGTVDFRASILGGIPPYRIKWYRNDTEITTVENWTTVMFTFDLIGTEIVKVRVTDTAQMAVSKQTTAIVLPHLTTTVKILPITNTFYPDETLPGDKFMVNATVQNVTDLALWQIKLTWDPSLLNFSGISLPTDHVFSAIDISINPSSPGARAMITIPPIVEEGSVTWGCTYINDPYWTFNGTGTLCQIELEILNPPTPLPVKCNLTVADKYGPLGTFLMDGMDNTIPIMLEGGIFSYVPAGIAVTEVKPSKTVVGQGYSMNITVTVENHSENTQTFNVTAHYNETAFILPNGKNYTTITLTSSNSTTVIFIWNTTGIIKSNYIISAYATPFPDETYTDDNTLIDGIVFVGVPCDITGPTPSAPDGICNMRDIGYICDRFNTIPSSPNWDPNSDVTGPSWGVPDNIVNMRDIGEACNNFMKPDP